MNYTELVALIQDYTEQREPTFVANIPRFVRQTEQRVYRTIMIPELRKNATATVAAGSQYVARPSDFLSVFSLALIDGSGNYSYLYDKDVNLLREAYPNPSTTGLPRYYAQFDGDTVGNPGNFIIAPSTDADYTAEIHYYYDPVSIVESETSWLGENAEAVLLNGAIVEAYVYLKGEADIMASYEKQYNSALGQLTGIDVRSKRDDYRDGQVRQQ
jgi:hypothetical protein|tara:strand:- start:1985 stop:2629 length:645 start_codon:yes stop_codon:yes gene_type:complete